jgi:hypothetical protein
MTRRIAHVVLLFAGLAPAVWAMCAFSSDPPRASVLAALAALGLALNGTALGRPRFGMTVPLRVIACGVALAVVAGVMGMWQWLRSAYLPELPESDVMRREIAVTAAHNLVWIAAAVAYVILTILIMPVPVGKSKPAADQPKRIDFRTFGR